MFLGLIETAGNQAYVFSTNRLQENVGASQRVWEAGVETVLDAAETVTGNEAFGWLRAAAADDPVHYAEAMDAGPRLRDDADIEIVVATSGKAVFLATERKTANALIAAATERAAADLPGLVLRGAVVEIDGDDAAAADRAVGAAHAELDAIRAKLPAPEARFPTLPVLEPCATSGLPAESISSKPVPGEPVSAVSAAKRSGRKAGAQRIAKLFIDDASERKQLATDIGVMEDLGVDWLGVIHADGNGMGQLFLEFGRICGAEDLEGYFEVYRRFSTALDLCVIAAFRETFERYFPRDPEKEKRGRIALIPLVLGGDDITVLCDGRIAPDFAVDFLEAYQEHTQAQEILGQRSIIPEVLANKQALEDARDRGAEDWSRLGAAAGVAITKPHYPFHRGYELAESLLKRAKLVKPNVGVSRCAIDFHVLFDGAETSLEDLRTRWTVPGETPGVRYSLTARPYVLGEAQDGQNAWARNRRWGDLRAAADSLSIKGESGDAGLPKSQQYELREALFRGAGTADRYLALIRHRYGADRGGDHSAFAWTQIAELSPEPSLFFPLGTDGGHSGDSGGTAVYGCRLLDAMELVDLGRPATSDAPEQAAAQ